MSLTLRPTTRLRANPNHVANAVRDEVVVLLMGKGEYYGLNAVGAHVWRLLQTERSFADLVDQIVAEYDVDRDNAVNDMVDVISDLHRHGLIELRDDP